MRILLDTHIYLWWLQDSRQLSKKARTQIAAADEVYVSSASIWEATIKAKIGKLTVDIEQLIQQISLNGFNELPVLMRHATTLNQLPNLHRDPFDNMLVAQAISEPLILLTADTKLQDYSELVEVV